MTLWMFFSTYTWAPVPLGIVLVLYFINGELETEKKMFERASFTLVIFFLNATVWNIFTHFEWYHSTLSLWFEIIAVSLYHSGYFSLLCLYLYFLICLHINNKGSSSSSIKINEYVWRPWNCSRDSGPVSQW